MNNLKNLPEKLLDIVKRYKRYLPIVFCLLLTLVYGFIAYRVQVLNAAEPDPNAAALQTKTSQVPQIDESVIKQLQSLQGNSPDVKSLFQPGRSDPFQ